MKLKFLVDSLRSTEKNYCGLKVFENQNLKFNYDPCPTGELVFDFGDINNETIIKFGYPDTLIKEYNHWILLICSINWRN